jgi:hypothetical protein
MSTSTVDEQAKAREGTREAEVAKDVETKAYETEEAERKKQAKAAYLQKVTPWREKLMGKKLSETPSESVRHAMKDYQLPN